MGWQRGHQLQDGKYTIREVLGEGGFGITYRVRGQNGRQFVVKTLNEEAQARPDFDKLQQDFMNEALRLAKFNHPHIVKVDRVFLENAPRGIANQGSSFISLLFSPANNTPNIALWCILMEYIEGENLNNYIKRQGALSESEALHYIRQIGEALTVIHREGLLHRDVKPDNIVLRANNGEAVLIDFGIARDFTPNHSTHTEMGTPCYAAIEQFYPSVAPPGKYTDVYALAATLYHLLTGELPSPTIVEEINTTHISNHLREAIRQGMALQPKDRPQSVQDWLKLLGASAVIPNPQPPKISHISRAVTIPSPYSDNLSSSAGVDYRNLRDLLKARKWQKADIETYQVMLQVAGREEKGWLDQESIEKFPCEDLRTIDKLWVKYSNGRFGFSVQKRIWQEEGGKVDWETESRLGLRVKWRKKGEWMYYHELNFSRFAPVGHLPVGVGFVRLLSRGVNCATVGFLSSSLASKLITCNI